MKKLLITFLFCVIATSCDKEPETLKSPCVGAKGSPCGDRIPVNQELYNYNSFRA